MAQTNDFYDLLTTSTPGLKEWNRAVFRTNEIKGFCIIKMQGFLTAFQLKATDTFYAKGKKHLNINVRRRGGEFSICTAAFIKFNSQWGSLRTIKMK